MNMGPTNNLETLATAGLRAKPSGRFSFFGLALMPAAGLMAALIFGSLYGYVSKYPQVLYFNFLFTLAYGVLLGAAVRAGARLGKVRPRWLAGLFGLAAGVFGLYVEWVVWLHVLLTRAEASLTWALYPKDIARLMGMIAEDGVWTIRSFTPAGTALYILWTIEALVIVGLSVMVSSRKGAREDVGESGEVWAAEDSASSWSSLPPPLNPEVSAMDALEPAEDFGWSLPPPPDPDPVAPMSARPLLPLAEVERLSLEARNLMDAGDPREALERYLQILAANPRQFAALKGAVAAALETKNAAVLKQHAGAAIRVLFQYGKHLDIVGQYGKVKAIAPDFVLPAKEQWALAQLYLKDRKFKEAARACRDLGEAYPDHLQAPHALFQCGSLMWTKLGNDHEARQMFESIKTKYPDSPFAKQADAALASLAGGTAQE